MNQKWKDIVNTVAPGIATVLGGPLAGAATKMLSEKLLGKSNGTEDEVANAVMAMSPADYVKLKEVEADLQKSLSDAGIKLEELSAKDRADARAREIATHDFVPAALGIGVTVGFIATLVYLIGHPVEKESQYLLILLGSLSTSWGMVMSYYFGSTTGSTRKTELLAKKE